MRNRRNQYRECPYCHDLLDPGEHCDCQERAEENESPAVSTNTTRPIAISYRNSILTQNAGKIKGVSV